MEFPRLLLPRVAVWRTPGELVVGGPDRAVAFGAVPPRVADLVGLLDGTHSLDQLTQACERHWVQWVLGHLARHHLLAEGPETAAPLAVEVLGEGVLAQCVAEALAGVAGTPGPGARRGRPLYIVAPGTVEADRVLVAELKSRGLPHLVVRAGMETGVVGPFVLPGTTCLTCTDLARRAGDPSWPVQVFQLSQIPADPPVWLCTWAAATAAAHALAYTRGLSPESTATTVEMSAATGRLTYRRWPRHPECTGHQL